MPPISERRTSNLLCGVMIPPPHVTRPRASGSGGAWISSRFGVLTRHFQKAVNQNMRAGSDAKRPIATKPPPRVFIGRRGTHHSRKQRPPVAQRTHRKRVDGFGKPGFCEITEFVR